MLFLRGLMVGLALGRRVAVVGDADARPMLRVALFARAGVVAGVVVTGGVLTAVAPVVAIEVTADGGDVAVSPVCCGPPLAEHAPTMNTVEAMTADLRSAAETTRLLLS